MKSSKKTRRKSLPAALAPFLRSPRIYIIAGVGISILLVAAFVVRTMLPVHAELSTKSEQKINEPLKITLTQKLRTIAARDITISPAVEGSWKSTSNALLGNETLTFTPKEYFRVNTTYEVQFPAAQRILGNTATVPSVTFTTEKAPSLTDQGLASVENNATIASDYAFVATLSMPNRQLRQLELRTTPSVAFSESDDDTTFTWKPKKLLPQSKKLTVELYDRKNNVSLTKKTLNVAAEPKLTSSRSRTHVGEHDNIELTFSQAIDQSTTKNISFSIDGSGNWKDKHTYRFTPKKLEAGKTYTYTIAKHLRSTQGGLTQNAIKGSFSTTGAVTVVGRAPSGYQLSQAKQTITFTFDQAVDHASAEQRFSINAGKITGFSWSGNTMYAGVKNLGYQRTVTATISPGVKNVGFGLPSTQNFSTVFTTEIRSKKLAIPYYSQQYAASCTAATLRMALAYRGISTNDMAIVNRMGYAPTKMNKKVTPHTWDDPREMFVGNVNGNVKDGTGAGPDAPPVAKAAQSFGRGASIAYGVSPAWIASQIYAGNPVIVFGAFTNSGFVSWKTPSGRTTKMNLSSHVTVITGVQGEPNNPLGFWVNDPLVGGTQFWTPGQLSADMARDAYGQVVVIY